MHRVNLASATQAVAELSVGQHLGDLGEKLQVLVRGFRRYEKYEHIADRLVVRGTERYG
jgi:hypothetical protein